MWICPACRIEQEDDITQACWSCGTPRGVFEDADLLITEEGAIEPPISTEEQAERLLADLNDGFAGDEPQATRLVSCYLARDLMEAEFLASQLREQGIPAQAERDTIWLRLSLTPRGVPYLARQVWVREQDRPRALAWLAEQEQQRLERAQAPDAPGWICEHCGEEVESTFEICWNCEYPRSDLRAEEA